MPHPRTYILILAVFIVYLAAYVLLYWDQILLDFAPMYVVAKVFLAGRWECFYDFALQQKDFGYRIFTGDCLSHFAAAADYPMSDVPMPLYLYSPTFIPLGAPLTLIPWPVVEKIVFVLNCAAVVAILFLCARIMAPASAASAWFVLLAALLILGEPTRWCIHTGQATPWMFLLTLGAWRMGERGGRREIAAGALLALAFWMKFFPGLFVLYWLRCRRWRAIAAFAVAAVLWFAAGWIIFGAAVHRDWLDVLKAMGTGVGIFGINQSFESFLMRFEMPIQSVVTTYSYYVPRHVKMMAMLCKAVVLIAYLSVLIRPALSARRRALQAAITLAVCPILLSVSWNHYAIFTLPLTVWLLAEAWERRRVWRWAIPAIIAMLAVLTFQYFHFKIVEFLTNIVIRVAGRDVAEPFAKILISRHLLGTLVFLAAGIVCYWRLNIADTDNDDPGADQTAQQQH